MIQTLSIHPLPSLQFSIPQLPPLDEWLDSITKKYQCQGEYMKRFLYLAIIGSLYYSPIQANQVPIVIGPGNTLQFPNLGQNNQMPEVQETSYQAPEQNTNLEIRGMIRLPDASKKIPEFRILFAGKETLSNREGFFSVPVDDQDLEKYALVFCSTVNQTFDKKNTLKNIRIAPNTRYRYFSFKKNTWGNTWQQQEKRIDKRNRIIPNRSIIVLINPTYIDKIQPWNIDLPTNIVKLPTILLKESISTKKIARASAKSLLHSLDTTIFHEPIKEEVQQTPNPKVAISLTQ